MFKSFSNNYYIDYSLVNYKYLSFSIKHELLDLYIFFHFISYEELKKKKGIKNKLF